MVNAVVLAGSLNNGLLRETCAVKYEALIPIGSKYMVEYVVEALIKSKTVNKIVVVGPSKELKTRFKDTKVLVAECGDSLMDSFSNGADLISGTDRVLVVTADIPLLTPQAVDKFIELCSLKKADVYYPIVPRETVERYYAQSRRTYVTLREGVFTGGNIFLVNPSAAKRCMIQGQEIINLRKSPLKLCRLVGLMFLIKFLLRTVSLKEAQEKASKLLGLKGQAVIFDFPEVGVDVDKPSDLVLVNELLRIKKAN